MKLIRAKIIDQTHLELSQPISVSPGEFIQISIIAQEGETEWKDASKKHFLDAYAEKDSIYDKI